MTTGPEEIDMAAEDEAEKAELRAKFDATWRETLWPKKRKVMWYLDLFRFGLAVEAPALTRWVQDVLIALCNDQIWVDLLIFATEQPGVQLSQEYTSVNETGVRSCSALKQAALQFGVRAIAPHVFLKFYYNQKELFYSDESEKAEDDP